jgi:hypothetical protein
MTKALQLKLLAAGLALLATLVGAYLRNSRQDHRPAYTLTEQDQQLSQKLAQKPPAIYQEP